jgi:LacI family transcriptional regulator
MAVTMKEVAAKAGVSPVVVSRVLHNKAKAIRVSTETAARVRQAAEDLGYRCNVWARNFRAQQTRMIGVVHGMGFGRPTFSIGPRYFAALMDGLVDGAFELNYSLTLCPQLLSQSPEDAMSDGRFDGLVWYSTDLTDENRQMIERCSVPLVLIHVHPQELGSKYSSVVCDNQQGIDLAIDHLISLGHERIGFAAQGSPRFAESRERLECFMRGMKKRNLCADLEDVIYVDWDANGVDEYLETKREHTAVICHYEGLAAEFINRAPKHGLEVPKDLSIVGFDSTGFCNELRPQLTSISQPLSLMGRKAIELLVIGIENGGTDPVELIYPCGLEIRGSTSTIHR